MYPKMTSLSKVSIDNGDKTYEFELTSKEVTTTDDNGSETTSTNTTYTFIKPPYPYARISETDSDTDRMLCLRNLILIISAQGETILEGVFQGQPLPNLS